MRDKIIELSVFRPHAYPWNREELGISIEEIDNILKDVELIDEPARRKAGYELDIICYLAATKAKDYGDLKKIIFDELKDRKYISEKLIEKELLKKQLANSEEVKAFIKFINKNMTIDEKNTFKTAVRLWLVELFYYYNCALGSDVETKNVLDYIMKIVNESYPENNFTREYVNKFRKVRGFNRQYVIDLICTVSGKFNNQLSSLLEKYVSKSDNNSSGMSIGDEIFDDIINDIPDFELSGELEEENSQNDKITEAAEKEDEIKENILEIRNQDEKKEDKTEMHLKGLAGSLGYKLIKAEQNLDEDLEIELLKELASYKKGAVLSELYNAYVNFDNISKENLEAVINNFFTCLKLQGFEADDTNAVGDKVLLDTKDLLSDFVLTNPIDKKGIIEGEIKYLSWIYKGKRVTPMVIKPLNR